MKNTIIPQPNFADKRLNTRYKNIIKKLLDRPEATIPQAMIEWKETKATYRFLDNKRITVNELQTTYFKQTKQKVSKDKPIVVLALQDTTELDFTSKPATQELGYLTKKHMQVIFVHSCLLTNENGLPYGLIHQQTWSRNNHDYGKRHTRRNRCIQDKESYKWLATIQTIDQQIKSSIAKQIFVIGDRESDIYELFAMERPANVHILVRASQNRCLENQCNLLQHITQIKTKIKINRLIPRNHTQPDRIAKLAITYDRVIVKAPNQVQGSSELSVILVKEINFKKDTAGDKKIQWVLLTTKSIINHKEAILMVDYYTKRWLIERFHYALKSGCLIEKIQLKNHSKIVKVLSLFNVIACQLLYLIYGSRQIEQLDLQKIFTSNELLTLQILIKQQRKSKSAKLDLKNIIETIARLGGFLARKNDHDPGLKVLWIGLRRFNDINLGMNIFKYFSKRCG